MTTVYRWIKCSTPGCDSKHSGFFLPDYDFVANLPDGWTTEPARCPECNNPQAEPSEDRILVVPLPCGAFTAYAPRTMTPDDWKTVQGICGAMAGEQNETRS